MLPAALPSSTGTRHRTHTLLIDQYLLGMRPIGCSSTHLLLKLLLIYGSVFVSSSLTGFHLACTSTSLGVISLRFHPVSFHAAFCCQARGSYIVPGATLLRAILIWYTVNRLLQQTLLHKPLPFYGFVFVFLSYSSYSSSSSSDSSSSSPSFLFCSLAGFHLECTSNSLGATPLWPAALPKAIKYWPNRPPEVDKSFIMRHFWCRDLTVHTYATQPEATLV